MKLVFNPKKWREEKEIWRRAESKKIIESVARTVGELDYFAFMSVVSGIDSDYKPVFVFPGRELHYRKVVNDQ